MQIIGLAAPVAADQRPLRVAARANWLGPRTESAERGGLARAPGALAGAHGSAAQGCSREAASERHRAWDRAGLLASDDAPAPPSGAQRFKTLSGAILFDARQIAQDTVLYLSLVGSLLFVLLAIAG